MAGSLKYHVARLVQIKRPTSTKLVSKIAVVTENGVSVKKNILTKEHPSWREIKRNKEGSFDLHKEDVEYLEGIGYPCIPWNERGSVEVNSPEYLEKRKREADAKKAALDAERRRKETVSRRREQAKLDREKKNKEALEEAQKNAKKAKGRTKPAPAAGAGDPADPDKK